MINLLPLHPTIMWYAPSPAAMGTLLHVANRYKKQHGLVWYFIIILYHKTNHL
jgi:hypothetical protein